MAKEISNPRFLEILSNKESCLKSWYRNKTVSVRTDFYLRCFFETEKPSYISNQDGFVRPRFCLKDSKEIFPTQGPKDGFVSKRVYKFCTYQVISSITQGVVNFPKIGAKASKPQGNFFWRLGNFFWPLAGLFSCHLRIQ